jgi:hypothetical protein
MRMIKYFRNKKSVILLVTTILTGLYLNSCVDDKWDIDKVSPVMLIDQSLITPIGYTTFVIGDMLNKFDSTAFIQKDADGLIKLVYEQNLDTFRGEQKITVKTQLPVVIPSFIFPAKFPASNVVSVTVPITSMPLQFNNDQLFDSLIVKQLIFRLSGSSTFTEPGEIIFKFSSVTKNGVAFSDTMKILGKSTNFVTLSKQKAVGYKMGFSTVQAGQSVLPITVQMRLFGKSGDNVSNGVMNLNYKVDSLHYYSVWGYMGKNDLLDTRQTIDISALNKDLAKGIDFKDPKMKIIVKNSYGLPVQMLIDSMSVYSKANNATYQVTPITFNFGKIDDYYHFNNDTAIVSRISNPSLFDAFFKAPESLTFHTKIVTNPNGLTAATRTNYLRDTSKVISKIQFEIPIWFKSSSFGQTDTMAFDMVDKSKSAKSLTIRIVSENGMPVDLTLQGYFVDENFHKLDSLFKGSDYNQALVASAIVDATTDKVKTPVTKSRDIVFTEAQIMNLEKTKNILLKVSLKTGGKTGQYVKFLTSYKLKLSLSCQFQAKVTLN